MPELTSEDIASVTESFAENNTPIIILNFNRTGALMWTDMTKRSFENQTGIAITYNNKVFSAPVAAGVLTEGNAEISGDFKEHEAKTLAGIITSGSLPARVRLLSIKNISQPATK